MPPSSLPARPNLDHLRNQAKDLLKAYRSGQPSEIERFRVSLSHYSRLTDDDLRRLSLSLGTLNVSLPRSMDSKVGCKCVTTSNERMTTV